MERRTLRNTCVALLAKHANIAVSRRSGGESERGGEFYISRGGVLQFSSWSSYRYFPFKIAGILMLCVCNFASFPIYPHHINL